MTKKQNKILGWLLVWAGLLVVVLYSPIGSPDLYTASPTYAVISQGAATGNNEIPNATKVKITTDNTDNSSLPDIPEVGTSALQATSNGTGNYASATTYSQGSSYAMQTQTYQNNTGSGGGSVFIASGGSRSSAGTSGGISTTGGIAGLSSSHTLTNTSVKQNATAQTLDTGGTDPGGDPDPGTLIPVGDGWGILLLLGVCYAALKKRTFLQRRFHFSTRRR